MPASGEGNPYFCSVCGTYHPVLSIVQGHKAKAEREAEQES